MRIEQLYYLTEVAKTKSINLTAEHIYVSQPSISEAIQKLEKELGVTLLNRSPQGVYLTEDGEKVVKRAREILKIVDELKSDLKSNETKTSLLKGSLLISYAPLINVSIIQKALSDFSKTYPKVNITLKEQLVEKLMLNIKDGKADLGLILIPDELLISGKLSKIDINNEFHFERLFNDKLVVGIGKTSPLSKRKFITIKQILKYPLAIYQTDNEDTWLMRLLKRYGEPKSLFKCDSNKLFKKLIIEGMAAGFFAKSTLIEDISYKEILYIPIRNNVQLSCGWIRSNNYPFSEAAQEFVKVLKSYC